MESRKMVNKTPHDKSQLELGSQRYNLGQENTHKMMHSRCQRVPAPLYRARSCRSQSMVCALTLPALPTIRYIHGHWRR